MKAPRARWVWFVKLGVGLSLLAWLLSTADFGELYKVLSQVHPGWLLVALTLPFLSILLSTLKWWELLRAKGCPVPLLTLFNLYMIGTFFNSFFPSMVGGDVVRVYQLARYGVDSSIAVASTFMERLTGLFGLVTVLPFVLLVDEVTGIADLSGRVWILEGLAIAGLVVLSVLLFAGRIVLAPGNEQRRGGFAGKVLSVVERSRMQVRSYRGHPLSLLKTYVLSVLFYLQSGVTLWTVVMSVGGAVEMWKLVLVAPLVLAIGLIPLSVNGLGILEAGYAWALITLGMSPAEAVSVALIIRGRLLLHALVGGLIFLAYRNRGTASAEPVPESGRSSRLTGHGHVVDPARSEIAAVQPVGEVADGIDLQGTVQGHRR